ncbi:hypothetical protein [Spirosoma spitsbergense]|uniref:hypothetical protein n=1 Tax=Spirosoma spitsbergense TaxID=431554 RepID=UPI000371F6B3|nr:hypothetical protein [Spirosoma spitsbergense]
MGALKPLYKSSTIEESTPGADCLTLYDRYGGLAYGIILQIIPEPEQAQRVLIDLFSSPQVKAYAEFSNRVSSGIIRLAREKALAARSTTLTKPLTTSAIAVNDTTDKLVFDLSFYKGYTIDEIADKLQLSRASVLTKISSYFKHHRSSQL